MNPEHIPQDIHVSIPLSDRERVNTKRAPKHIDHVFDIDIANMILTEEQQHVMDNILQNSHRLHILTGTPGSGKTFFVKYIAQYFQKYNKKWLSPQPQEQLHSGFQNLHLQSTPYFIYLHMVVYLCYLNQAPSWLN